MDVNEKAVVREAVRRGPRPGEPVLSVLQPWAFLIVEGYKAAENRTWDTAVRGIVWIHASSGTPEHLTREECEGLGLPQATQSRFDASPASARGAIVGAAYLSGCYAEDDLPPVLTSNPYATGPVVWHLEAAMPLAVPIRYRNGLRLPGYDPARRL